MVVNISMGVIYKYLLLFLIFSMPASIYASSGEVLIVFPGKNWAALNPAVASKGRLVGFPAGAL